VWLYYKPELSFLKSRDAALTLQRAEEIAAKKPFDKTGKRNLVFAPAKFAPNKALHEGL
jgi:adenine-specific DNA-methyltransferase